MINVDSSNSSHRKFLKEPNNFDLNIGDYATNLLIDSEKNVYLFDLIKDKKHMMAVFFNTECSTCELAMETLKSYAIKKPYLNIVAFIHTSSDIFSLLCDYFSSTLILYHIPKKVMNEGMRIYSFPKAFTLNEVGQVLSLEVCGEEFIYDILVLPLRKILQGNEEGCI